MLINFFSFFFLNATDSDTVKRRAWITSGGRHVVRQRRGAARQADATSDGCGSWLPDLANPTRGVSPTTTEGRRSGVRSA